MTDNSNYERFATLPESWTHATVDKDGKCPTNTDPMKWSGRNPPPPVGTKVKVTMNALGPGEIKGYFVEHGWLGVLVDLSKPPAWWRKQNKDNPDRLAHIFGTELEDFK